jgi:hypothetical protein
MLRRLYIALILVLVLIATTTGVYYYSKPSKSIYLGFRAIGSLARQPEYWVNLTKQVASTIPETLPAGIWIVGRLEYSPPGVCFLSFPSNQTYSHVLFQSQDLNEDYLTAFDDNGIKIWLQVEPGFAEIDQLIDLVMKRYSHHTCILGFGIDLEWRWGWPQARETVPVTDEEANQWLNRTKSFNPNFKLFLKHWLPKNMPPTVRQDIVFIDDAQHFGGLDSLVHEFKLWGENFTQTNVGFQVGYISDQEWWSKLENPPRDVGLALIQNIPNCRFIFWTDETIHGLFPPSWLFLTAFSQ